MRDLGTRIEGFLEALPSESGFVFGAREAFLQPVDVPEITFGQADFAVQLFQRDLQCFGLAVNIGAFAVGSGLFLFVLTNELVQMLQPVVQARKERIERDQPCHVFYRTNSR